MRPYMELEAMNVKMYDHSAVQYNSSGAHDGLVMMYPYQDQDTRKPPWFPIEGEYGPLTGRQYSAVSTSLPLPPGLSLNTSTGEISGVWELAESETGDRGCQFDIQTLDLWGRRRSSKVRMHLYYTEHAPEHLSYPQASVEDSTSHELSLVNELSLVYGVNIHIPAHLLPGSHRVECLCRTHEELPEGLMLHTDTGDLSGTPMKTGRFEVTVEAHDSVGSFLCTLQLIVVEPQFQERRLQAKKRVEIRNEESNQRRIDAEDRKKRSDESKQRRKEQVVAHGLWYKSPQFVANLDDSDSGGGGIGIGMDREAGQGGSEEKKGENNKSFESSDIVLAVSPCQESQDVRWKGGDVVDLDDSELEAGRLAQARIFSLSPAGMKVRVHRKDDKGHFKSPRLASFVRKHKHLWHTLNVSKAVEVNTAPKFETTEMHLGRSADSVLKTFIGLEDKELAKALSDPIGMMEKEWFPIEYWPNGFCRLQDDPNDTFDKKYKDDLEILHREYKEKLQVSRADYHIELKLDLKVEEQRLQDEYEDRKYQWWLAGANFDYVVYGTVGDSTWQPPQVQQSFIDKKYHGGSITDLELREDRFYDTGYYDTPAIDLELVISLQDPIFAHVGHQYDQVDDNEQRRLFKYQIASDLYASSLRILSKNGRCVLPTNSNDEYMAIFPVIKWQTKADNRAFGLRWENAGGDKPTKGRHLTHSQLANILQSQTEFTYAEWESFGISDLRAFDFIKVGDSYWKAAGKSLYLLIQVLPDMEQGRGPDECWKVAQDLRRQATDASALLRKGNLTCNARSVTLRRKRSRKDATLSTFETHETSEIARLVKAEVAALRLYTSDSFRLFNNPMRQRLKPHPLKFTVYFLDESLTKLRTVDARLRPSQYNQVKYLWRGMRNMTLDEAKFMEEGGSELAAMSTTEDLHVAKSYSDSEVPLIFRFEARGRSRGVDIGFLSLYAKEKEFLYAPLTGLILLHVHDVNADDGSLEKLARAVKPASEGNGKGVKKKREDEILDQMQKLTKELELIQNGQTQVTQSDCAKEGKTQISKTIRVYDVRPMK